MDVTLYKYIFSSQIEKILSKLVSGILNDKTMDHNVMYNIANNDEKITSSVKLKLLVEKFRQSTSLEPINHNFWPTHKLTYL